MESTRERNLKDILEILSILESNIRLHGKIHYFDLHTSSEDPICALLCLLFNCKLKNLNHEQMNFPGIDLADRQKRLAVQVTSSCDRKKVYKTLAAFQNAKIHNCFDSLMILVLGRKPTFRKPFNTQGLKLEILDLDDLARIISGKENALIEAIAQLLRNCYVFRTDRETLAFRQAYANEDTLYEQLPHLQETFLRRFRSSLICGPDANLSLKDLYIPNPYRLGKISQPFDNLPDFISHFLNKTTVPGMSTAVSDSIALIVEGQQCTGKSTLVANIINQAYFHWNMPIEKVHLLTFGERDLRTIKLTAINICKYLNLKSVKQFQNALILIDALDESDWSAKDACEQLENLIDDLNRYNCKLIVTVRPNYMDTDTIPGVLNVSLEPFSLSHAERWLDIYGSSDRSLQIDHIKSNLRQVPSEILHVILLPHVLQICVTHGITLGNVMNLNQLYDLIFRGPDGLFLRDQFFPNIHEQHKRFQKMLGTAAQIAIFCLKHDNLIHADKLQQYIAIGDSQMERLKTEYLLERHEGNMYSFAHKTIPAYLIALYLYEAFSCSADALTDQQLTDRICPVITSGAMYFGAVFHSLEQMSVEKEPEPGIRAEMLLQKFLTDKLESEALRSPGHYHQANQHYEVWFDALVRLVFALKTAWRNENGEFHFFEALKPDAWKRFCQFFNHGKSNFRSCDYIRHSIMENLTISGLDLSKTDMHLKCFRAMVMHRTSFEGAILRGTYFLDSDISASDFSEAYCSGAQFSNSILCSASFVKATVRGTRFTNCDLSHADFRGANMEKVLFENCVLNSIKIEAEQLRDHKGLFDLECIRKNHIRIYWGDCELPEELIADEYRRQRPVIHAIAHSKAVFTGENIKKAEMVQRFVEMQGTVTQSQIREAYPKISRSTIQLVLSNMLQNGQITKSRGGRYTVYCWNEQ